MEVLLKVKVKIQLSSVKQLLKEDKEQEGVVKQIFHQALVVQVVVEEQELILVVVLEQQDKGMLVEMLWLVLHHMPQVVVEEQVLLDKQVMEL
jgi:hypothetical protein